MSWQTQESLSLTSFIAQTFFSKKTQGCQGVFVTMTLSMVAFSITTLSITIKTLRSARTKLSMTTLSDIMLSVLFRDSKSYLASFTIRIG
jgi:hypothetical protein